MTEPFRFSNGQLAYSVQDLIGVCQQSPDEGLAYLKKGDFENWLAYIGEGELSKKAQELRRASLSDEDKLKKFLTSLQSPKAKKSTSTPTQPTTKTVKESTPTPETVNPVVKLLQSLQSLFTGSK
ncbi:hypothetical protein [Crocosphaera sp. XPORK-15E]|uniref:hypothetical protein n=1 Tax=Crocosphaera sp. XPORK-15E TaxID=3110247 RepID=UPI002B1ECEE9|nr:hypothetical protein [Crocosphaera sp. XPORK-15E]MEA5534442.1 hypothetical protein [Crocosphaera sp. XPORK-15E]